MVHRTLLDRVPVKVGRSQETEIWLEASEANSKPRSGGIAEAYSVWLYDRKKFRFINSWIRNVGGSITEMSLSWWSDIQDYCQNDLIFRLYQMIF